MNAKTLTNYEALLALSTSPQMTSVMRDYITCVLAEHRALVAVLGEYIAATDNCLTTDDDVAMLLLSQLKGAA